MKTEEELAAISSSVEQSSKNVRYVNRKNAENIEAIYTTQELGNITPFVHLQQVKLKGNSEGNKSSLENEETENFKEKPNETYDNIKIRIKDRVINIIRVFC